MGCREQPHFRAGLCASPQGLATLGKEPIPARQWQRNPSAFPLVPNLGVQSSGTALPVPRSPQFPSSSKRVLECDFVALFSPWPHMAASVLGYLSSPRADVDPHTWCRSKHCPSATKNRAGPRVSSVCHPSPPPRVQRPCPGR